MFNNTNIIEKVIIIEFVVVALFIVLTYVTNFYYLIRDKINQNTKIKLQAQLMKFFESNAITPLADILKKVKIGIMVDWLYQVDRQYQNDENWQNHKKIIIKNGLLDRARKLTNSHDWLDRNFVTLVYQIYSELEDVKNIIALLNDKILLVRINAVKAAINMNKEPVLNAIIDAIQGVDRHTVTLFKKQFNHSTVELDTVLERRLTLESKRDIRMVCYFILEIVGVPPQFFNFAKQDLASDDLDLQIVALKILAKADPIKAEPIVQKYLTASEWQLRSTASSLVGSLNMQDCIPNLAHNIQDSNWWVRINTAKSLSLLGEKGQAILRQQNVTVDPYAYDVANYILQLQALQE